MRPDPRQKKQRELAIPSSAPPTLARTLAVGFTTLPSQRDSWQLCGYLGTVWQDILSTAEAVTVLLRGVAPEGDPATRTIRVTTRDGWLVVQSPKGDPYTQDVIDGWLRLLRYEWGTAFTTCPIQKRDRP